MNREAQIWKNVAVGALFAFGSMCLAIAVCGVGSLVSGDSVFNGYDVPAVSPSGGAGGAGGVDWVGVAGEYRRTVAPAIDGYIDGADAASRRLDDTQDRLWRIQHGYNENQW